MARATDAASLYFSLFSGGTLEGDLSVSDDDIILFDGIEFSLLFDGSDVGLSNAKLDAFALIGQNELLLSFSSKRRITGISGSVDDSDVVKFTGAQMSATTDGSFELFLTEAK